LTKTINVTDSTFNDEVINANIPVLVDFWAEWCGPCKMIGPIVENLAEEFDGKMKFVKVDVDSSPSTAAQFGIRSIPSLIIFNSGQPVDQIVGAVPKSVLQDRIESTLA
jgi:thioredoxin 1